MIFAAAVQGFSWPTLGYFVARIQMVLVSYETNPDWKDELDQLLVYLVSFCCSMPRVVQLFFVVKKHPLANVPVRTI